MFGFWNSSKINLHKEFLHKELMKTTAQMIYDLADHFEENPKENVPKTLRKIAKELLEREKP